MQKPRSEATGAPDYDEPSSKVVELVQSNPAELKERLRIAREKREQVLAARAAAADRTDGDSAAGAMSLEGRLKAAREARERAAEAQRITAPTPAQGKANAPQRADRPQKRPVRSSVSGAQNRPRRHLSADAAPSQTPERTVAVAENPPALAAPDPAQRISEPRKGTRTWAVLAGATVVATLVAGLWSITLGPLNPTRPGPEDSEIAAPQDVTPVSADARLSAIGIEDLVVVVQNGAGDPDARLGDTPHQLRRTPFQIPLSTVEFFNDADAESAANLAKAVGAEVIDARGLQPSPPPGRVILHLSQDDG